MTVVRDKVGSLSSGSGAATRTSTFATNPTAGDKVFLAIWCYTTTAPSTVSDNGGNTYTQDKSFTGNTGDANLVVRLYRADNVALPGSGTLAVSAALASDGSVCAISYSGVAAGGPTGSNTNFSASNATGGNSAAAGDSATGLQLGVQTFFGLINPENIATTAPFAQQGAEQDGSSFLPGAVSDQLNSAASGTCSWTWTTSARWSALIVAYAPAGGAANVGVQSTARHPGKSPGYGGARFYKTPRGYTTPSVDQAVALAAVASAETVGQSSVSQTVSLAGVGTAEVVGQSTINQTVSLAGVAGAEQIGAAQLGLTVTLAGVGSAEVVGTSAIAQSITLAGVGSAELVPAGAVSLIVSPAGVGSAEAVGQPSISQTVFAAGVRSAEAISATAVAQSIALAGLPSVETAGAVALTPGPVTVSPAGLSTQETAGTVNVSLGAPQAVALAGLGSAEKVGSPRLDLAVAPAGVGYAEAIGAAAVTPGSVTVTLAGIGSAERVGASSVAQTLNPAGVGSGERIGAVTVTVGTTVITLAGVPSGATGAVAVQPGPVTVSLVGVGSFERVGPVALLLGALFYPALDPRLTVLPNLSTARITSVGGSAAVAPNPGGFTITPNLATAAVAANQAEADL